MSRKFWNWLKNEQYRTLFLDGYIAEDSWFEDDITPKQFKNELYAEDGDVVVMLNSRVEMYLPPVKSTPC